MQTACLYFTNGIFILFLIDCSKLIIMALTDNFVFFPIIFINLPGY